MPKIPLMDFDLYPPFEGFPKECINFLKQLKRNNNRVWFENHKEEFEQNAKTPMLSFIVSLQPHFARFAPEFDLNPKRSIFRFSGSTAMCVSARTRLHIKHILPLTLY